MADKPKKRATVVQIQRRQIVNAVAAANAGRDKALARKKLIAFDKKHGEARTRRANGK